jgi:hypothetical protein
MDTRTRWIIGLLLALVIGLVIGLIIVAGDGAEDSGTTVTVETSAPRKSTGTSATTQPTTSNPTGGTPAPPVQGKGPSPGGSGGL